MRQFKSTISEEVLEIGKLDHGPGAYLQIAENPKEADNNGDLQYTVWLSTAQLIGLAEYILRTVRKHGEIE